MARLTDHEADLVRRNPGLFDKATEDEAWAMHHARLRAAAGHAPSRPIQRPAGPLARLVVDNDADPDLQHTLDELADWRARKDRFEADCFWSDMGIGFPAATARPQPAPTLAEDGIDETRASWGDRLVLAFSWIVMLLPVIALLAGCTTTGKAPECRSCIGAYDVSLSSHREALE